MNPETLVIKAQQYRTQEKNRSDALQRLADIITSVKFDLFVWQIQVISAINYKTYQGIYP
jgi:protein subunit release factor B